ncbi:MAG: DUF418 domain-containing protein [Muribaculaceae bacterium]|nr:DUF418 domain-containing protein [Muribaculaceae bacterium]
MNKIRTSANGAPVDVKKRHIILDALRGFALLGICLANYPEFSLYTFLQPETVEALPSYGIDLVTKYFLYVFIDGKFYTIFSLLFGVGFSIILENNKRRGVNGTLVFYRRMFALLIIGFLHLMLVWSGDILMLYALVGMLLPLFYKRKDKTILIWASGFLILPVIIDFVCQFTSIYMSAKLVEWEGLLADSYGISDKGYAFWLRDAQSYGDVFKFLVMGSVERLSEFVDGNRYFKVAGLFLLGFLVGRHRLYERLEECNERIRTLAYIFLGVGLPLSVLYAWSAVTGKPWGLGAHSSLYFGSVYVTGFGYVMAFCTFYISCKNGKVWKILAFPGRMALTDYIGQSFIGMWLFYGIGFGIGASVGLFITEMIALGVFWLEVVVSALWLGMFRYGPLEWIWRCVTYKRFFSLLNSSKR